MKNKIKSFVTTALTALILTSSFIVTNPANIYASATEQNSPASRTQIIEAEVPQPLSKEQESRFVGTATSKIKSLLGVDLSNAKPEVIPMGCAATKDYGAFYTAVEIIWPAVAQTTYKITFSNPDVNKGTAETLMIEVEGNNISNKSLMPYVTQAKTEIMQSYGLDMPDGLPYTVCINEFQDSQDMRLSFTHKNEQGKSLIYSVYFSGLDITKGTAVARTSNFQGETEIATPFKAAALSAFKTQLGITVPATYSMTANIQNNGEKSVRLFWYDENEGAKGKIHKAYTVEFINADFSTGTGAIKELVYKETVYQGEDKDEIYDSYSESDVNQMIKSARVFADKNGIKLGDFRYKLQGPSAVGAVELVFVSDGDKTSSIYFNPDGKISGYLLDK